MTMLQARGLTSLLAAVLLVALFGCSPETQKTPSTDPRIKNIISAVIEAYGGEKALRSIHGFRMKGDQLAVQGNEMIRVDRWFARPDRLRLELAYPDHHETRFTDGATGFSGSAAYNVTPAHPLKLQAMRLQTARLDPPIRLLEREQEVELREADSEGRIVLRLPLGSGLYLDSHIDPNTHRITHMTMGMPGPPAMDFSADYDQFHQI